MNMITLPSMKEVMNWHYKHTVVNCWREFTLQVYLQNFLDLVADLLDEGEGYLFSPSSSGEMISPVAIANLPALSCDIALLSEFSNVIINLHI